MPQTGAINQQVKNKVANFYALGQLPVDVQDRIANPDFEDEIIADAVLKADLDDLFGNRTSGADLDSVSDDEWEALKGS
jgi:hypothetical protein